jgi:hypothetical protein
MNEPVAWMDGQGNLYRYPDDADRGQTMRPLFFAQSTRPTKILNPNLEPGWKRGWFNLTDEEMTDIVAETDWGEQLWQVVCLTKIIEARLKEKNT